jgi:TonB family protein
MLMLAVCASASTTNPRALVEAQQQPTATSDRAQGIELYRKGEIESAIKLLQGAVKRNKDDLSAWHYLGLAFNQQGKAKEARKAHEQAARLGDRLIMSQIGSLKPSEPFIFSLSTKTQLGEAADSAAKYLETGNLSGSKAEDWRERAEYLRDFYELADTENGPRALFTAKEVQTKARILSRPEPQYTEEARQHEVYGTVVLRAILTPDGRVRAIFPIHTLPRGLTANAIRAARQIRFDPATIDGKPVSMFIQIEYNFNLY